MKIARNIFLLLFLMVVLSGCKHTPFFGWFTNIFINDTSNEFVLDNDAVFDLFEDGGTSLLDLDPSNTEPIPEPVVSTTVDPDYDKVGKMTPDELAAMGILEIPVLLLGGNEFPFPAKQFGNLAGEDKCDHAHYHSPSGFSIDLENVPEPTNPCGFDNNVTQRTVTGHQMIDWFHNRPRNF